MLRRRDILYHFIKLFLEPLSGGIACGHISGKDSYRIPEITAQTLHCGKFGLAEKRGNSRGALHLLGSCRIFVGRPLSAQLKTKLLAGFAGNSLSQEGSPLMGGGISVDADKLIAGIGGHLNLLSAAVVGGKP